MASILPTLQFIARHPLSSRQRLKAYWRYARWQFESRLCDEVVVDWIHGSKLAARNGMTGATGNIYCGLHEFVDMGFLLHLLRPGDLFVDVGANVGSYTVLASAVCGAHCIAIEPDPGAASALRKNIAINQVDHLVEVVEAAVGAAEGSLEFTVGNDTTNRIARAGDLATRHVTVKTLDAILAGTRPFAIKMDVEAYEPQVVASAAAALDIPSLVAVITESPDARVTSVLQQKGFVRAYYNPFTRSMTSFVCAETIPSANQLYVRSDQIAARLMTAPFRSVLGLTV